MRMIAFALVSFLSTSVWAEKILIYMDLAQTDHLRAYGAAYKTLELGSNVEWLLNYRGGSFMMDHHPEVEKFCRLKGVAYSILSGAEIAGVYQTIGNSNMDVVLLEKPPRVAVYVPQNSVWEPWDDAVTLALDYTEISYEKVWDKEILYGVLDQYDWIHLHHEDFSGQFGKFYSYRNHSWYQEAVRTNEKLAKELGFQKVWEMKHASARAIKEYLSKGGFVFSMCSAPVTLDIALASGDLDIVSAEYDGDPFDPSAPSKLNFEKTLAFQNFRLEMNPQIYEHSNVDVTSLAARRGPETYFTLFDFSAKYDPVPTMLTQCHVSLVKEFLGQDTGFNRDRVKGSVVKLAEVEGTEELKYIHGNVGQGTFTYLGGHDPEDYQHMVGDPPTRLELHKNSPGYRLILNNILFPAARKKEQKT
ncbi:asparagine synthetase B [candidate division TA06 bacterium]|nr:asparagine synthetase B [candidate division TA06 bacterium]